MGHRQILFYILIRLLLCIIDMVIL